MPKLGFGGKGKSDVDGDANLKLGGGIGGDFGGGVGGGVDVKPEVINMIVFRRKDHLRNFYTSHYINILKSIYAGQYKV